MFRKFSLPVLLSFNGGYVDTAGFLALQGLFTAHVTGNFVTFGAAMVNGASGAGAKLLALPVFCIVVVLARLLHYRLQERRRPVLRTMLWLQWLLLLIGAILAITLAPFPKGDSWRLLATGMTLVSAMAIQNAVARVHLATAPPTTLMTGTTTQIMLDLADLWRGQDMQPRAATLGRLKRLTASLAAFALGCGLAALAEGLLGMWAFAAPPVLILLALATSDARAEAQDAPAAAPPAPTPATS